MHSVDDSTVGSGSGVLPVSGRLFDAVVSVFSFLLVAGIAADFRSHANGVSFAEEGFFTPEHVFFYVSFLGVAGVLSWATVVRRRAGADWVDAVPDGYGLAVVGVLVFGFGGVGDFAWHSAFGFEESFEALVSPSHLALAVGAVLFLSAPMRASFRRADDASGLVASLPVVVSLTLVLAILGLFGGFVNPLVRPYPSFEYASMQSTVTMLVVWPFVYVGSVVVVLRRLTPPPGAFSVAFGLSGLAVAQAEGHVALVVPAIVVGVLADAFVLTGPPRPSNERAFRAFAAVLPAVFATTYFVVVDARWGIDHSPLHSGMVNWSVHVVVGAIVLASLAGVLLSLVVGGESTPGARETASGRTDGGRDATDAAVGGEDA